MELKSVGRYEIIKLLGSGGMADVYLAHDPQMRRDVAVKVIRKEFVADEGFVARFQREARIVADLQFDGVVPVYDYGEQHGLPYLVLRYMPGGTLSDRIQHEPLALSEAAHMLTRIGSALDKAHARALIHRDLKPDNILFDEHGDAAIADFGIARVVLDTESLTKSGEFIGTPRYMSPEQIQDKGDLDYRSDLYLLGIIFYEGLTGRMPFTAESSVGYITAHLNDPVPDIRDLRPDLPPAFTAILSKSMAKDRDDRYQSAADFVADVTDAIDSEAADLKSADLEPAEAVSAEPEPDTSPRRLPYVLIVGAVTLIAVVGILLSGVLRPAASDPDQTGDQSSLDPSTTPQIAESPTPTVVDPPEAAPTDVFASLNLAGKIVYTYEPRVDHGGGEEVFSMNADGSNQTRLTTEEGADTHPDLSPDGTRITFTSERDGNPEIYVMNVDGSGQMRLTDDPADDTVPRWSPDGKQIVFISTRAGDSTELFVMDSDGGSPTQVTTESARVTDPAWSPDGSRIAYVSSQDGDSEIVLIDPDGSNRTQLTDNASSDIYPAWSPDGSQIAYIKPRGGFSGSIALISADGGNMLDLDMGSHVYHYVGWSPDGQYLVTSEDEPSGITLIHLQTLERHPLLNDTADSYVFVDWSISTSQEVVEERIAPLELPGEDGGWIAFDSNVDGNQDIYKIRADGESLTRLTDHEAPDYTPSWSPDGTQIAFVSERDGNRDLYRMDADGGGVIRLTEHDAADYDPAWSPDGARLAFVSDRDGNPEIYIMEIATQSVTRVTDNPDVDEQPAWSPDGTQLTFVSMRGHQREVYTIDADGSRPFRVTYGSSLDISYDPHWNPVRAEIALMSDRFGINKAYVFDLTKQNELGGPGNLAVVVDSDGSLWHSAAWSSDGQWLVVSSRIRGSFQLNITTPDGTIQSAITTGSADKYNPDWWSPLPDEPTDAGSSTPDLPPEQIAGWVTFDTDRDGDREVYKIRANGTSLTRLTEDSAPDYDPAWSPDGTHIVFVSERDGSADLYVMDSEGGNLTRLTNDPAIDDQPAWSPDGTQIAFISTRDGNPEVYVMSPDGSNVSRLTDNPGLEEHPTWSGDSLQIAYISDQDGDLDVYVMGRDGSSPARMTDSQLGFDLSRAFAPDWDPAGPRIAFISDRGGEEVFVFDPSQGIERSLTNPALGVNTEGAFPHSLVWSPDGLWLLVSLRIQGEYQLSLTALDGTENFQLTVGNANHYNPDWWAP